MEKIKIKRCPNFRHVVQCTCPKEVCRVVQALPSNKEDTRLTAVEYLGYELNTKLFYDISPELWVEVEKIFQQAKQIEKEDLHDAWNSGIEYGCDWIPKDFEEYYKKTYGTKSM
jgi:hypothetical protein